MDDTFYLSNIVPQDIDNNAGFWNRFEMYCRDLAKRFDRVQVVSGPMVLPSTLNDRGQRVVTYPVTIKSLLLSINETYLENVAMKHDHSTLSLK